MVSKKKKTYYSLLSLVHKTGTFNGWVLWTPLTRAIVKCFIWDFGNVSETVPSRQLKVGEWEKWGETSIKFFPSLTFCSQSKNYIIPPRFHSDCGNSLWLQLMVAIYLGLVSIMFSFLNKLFFYIYKSNIFTCFHTYMCGYVGVYKKINKWTNMLTQSLSNSILDYKYSSSMKHNRD